MDYNAIRILLEKYWEGESSLEEEASLQTFFGSSQEDLPEDLAAAAPLFRYFRHKAEEQFMPVAKPLQVITTGNNRLRNMRRTLTYAATLLFILAIGYFVRQRSGPEPAPATVTFKTPAIDDPEQAYAETKKALLLLSTNLNKGTSRLQQLSYFNEATTLIEVKN